MNRRNATYQTLTRVVAFGNLNVSLFPVNSVAADLLKAIESGVVTLSDETRNQLSAEALMKAGTKAKVAARETLKGHIIRVGEISRALEGDVKLPDVRSDQNLINAGRQLAEAAESMKTDLVAHGLPANFGDEIAAAADELERTAASYTQARSQRIAAVNRWDAALKPALKALRRFDALVHNALKDDPGALASYEVLRAMPKGRQSKEEETTTPTLPATAKSAAA
jgi:hypothetical protein